MNARPLAAPLAALALALPAVAAAQDAGPPPGGLADLTGARPLALAGGTGLVSGNDGVFVNPAATAARKRYAIDGFYALDRRGSSNAGAYLGASVVDALSAPVAVSFAWLRPVDGPEAGNAFLLGLAGEVKEKLYLGVQGRWQKVTTTSPGGAVLDQVNVVNADAGLLWELSDLVTVGASAFNLVPTGHETLMPRSVGAGLAIGSDTSVKLTADWRADLDRVKDPSGKAKTTNRYGAGLEGFLGNMAALRVGYLKDETLDTTWWSAGAGLVTQSGAALDVGYRQSISHPDARVVAISFKFQFLNL